MTVLITLTTAGDNTGPFDLYSNANGYTIAFATGVSKSALIAGYESTVVPNGTTEVLVQSIGACDRDLYLNVAGAPTTTTTTSTSTTSTTSTTTTLVPPIECYGYEVCAYDGTVNKNDYPFSYIDCNGMYIESGVVNTRCREICAQKDSVDSTSGFIFITETGPCL